MSSLRGNKGPRYRHVVDEAADLIVDHCDGHSLLTQSLVGVVQDRPDGHVRSV